MPYGSLYYGKTGFLHKKYNGGGATKTFNKGSLAANGVISESKYIPGAGVGASSFSTRRARIIRATTCDTGHTCDTALNRLNPIEQFILKYHKR